MMWQIYPDWAEIGTILITAFVTFVFGLIAYGIKRWIDKREAQCRIVQQYSDKSFIEKRAARTMHWFNLSKCSLQGLDLERADFMGANFRKADLSEANLFGANLRGADLRGADLRWACLDETVIDNKTKIEDKWRLVWQVVNKKTEGLNLAGADLEAAYFIRVDLGGLNLKKANFWGSALIDANLSDADLRDTDLRKANLAGTYLAGAKLKGARIDDDTKLDDKWRLVWKIVNQQTSRNLNEKDLAGANLEGVDLSGANLEGADLSGANLTKANLAGAKLKETWIDDATQLDDKWWFVWKIVNRDEYEGDFTEIDFAGTDLVGANLEGADLSGTDLNGADLRETRLTGADLSGAKLKGSKIDDTTQIDDKWRLVWKIVNQRISGHALRGIDLTGANLKGSDLSGANLSGVDLKEADLREANLTGAKLKGANIDGTTQIDDKWRWVFVLLNWQELEVDLSQYDLVDVDLVGANLEGADLSGINLKGVKLDETTQIDDKWRCVWKIINQKSDYKRNLSGKDFTETNLEGADLNSANLSGADMSGANLRRVNLSNGNLQGTNLMKADLKRANLTNSDLTGANLKDANLCWALIQGANLSMANLKGAMVSTAVLNEANLGNTNLNNLQLSQEGCFIEHRTETYKLKEKDGFGGYKEDHKDFNEFISLWTPEGDYLGECMITIKKAVPNTDPQQVTAFEITLFDSTEPATLSRVVMSEYAFNNDTDLMTNIKSNPNAEAVLAAPGTKFIMETSMLRVVANIDEMKCGLAHGPHVSLRAMPQDFNRIFKTLTLILDVYQLAPYDK